MASFTIAFTGTSSVLRADFFPEISLDPNSQYCCALLDFTSYNSIANIIEGKNNEFKFKCVVKEKKKVGGNAVWNEVSIEKTISIPTGSYEVEDILKYLKAALALDKISLTYEISVTTLKAQMSFDFSLDWQGGTLLNVIGFQNNSEGVRTFKKGEKYWSEDIARITDIDVIRVECDIVEGSYINGKHCHTIHQFSHCKVKPGYKFIEVPQHIAYLPIKEKQLQSIQISIVDQNNNLIDFRGEQISCRIHIKRLVD